MAPKQIHWDESVSRKRARRPRRVQLEDLLSLEEGHPYGCLPGGNQFFVGGNGDSATTTPTTTTTMQRKETRLLPDTVWQQILGFCNAPTLLALIHTSRYFYVAGHQPELWRDLVLRRCYKETRVIDEAGHSWRDTYTKLFGDKNARVHRPMAIPQFYSDEFYRTHRCRSFAIPEAWLRQESNDNEEVVNGVVPTVQVDQITPEYFMQRFEEQNQPVIVKNAGRTPALEHWQDFEYLQKHNAASKSFRTTSGGAPLPANFTLEAYKAYSKFSYLEESPLYLFDRTAFDDNDQWKQDFFPKFYQQCPWWDPSKSHGHDLLQHLGEKERPDHTWLIMGPKRSGSVFHIDPNATHAWNVCVQGRKRWIFYPPGVSPPGIFPSDDGDEVALPLSVGEWLMQYWPEHLDQYKKPIGQRPMECTVHPGDVVFVPHGWWHMVINLDDSNIAITHNYVSPSNLGNVLKFFADKQDQISGCRDRKESIKPEALHEAFTMALSTKEPKHLARAQEQTGWTCKAWKEDKTPSKKTVESSGDTNSSQTTSEIHGGTSLMSKTEKVASFSFSFL